MGDFGGVDFGDGDVGEAAMLHFGEGAVGVFADEFYLSEVDVVGAVAAHESVLLAGCFDSFHGVA